MRPQDRYRRAARTLSLLSVFAVGLAGCRGLKYATEERPLFSVYEIELESQLVDDRREALAELASVVIPAPNNDILGLRPTVALYNMTKEPKVAGKGLRNTLKYKMGSAPIYLDMLPLNDIDAAMENRLNNRGYFAARASHEVKLKGRTASVVFRVDPGLPHRLRNITYGDTAVTDTLQYMIAASQRAALIRTDDAYRLDILKEERQRISDQLRNSGYYHFNDGDLVFVADTTVGDRQVDIHLHVKAEAEANVLQRYTLDSVWVHGDRDELLPPNDTLTVDSLEYVNYLNMYRPGTVTRGVFIEPGKPYSQRRTDQTQQYLSSYGVFRDVRVNYMEDSAQVGLLRADVMLVPMPRFSLFSELNAISKSNNFAGPGMKVGFKDRDLFRGAEVLTIDFNGRFESQISGPNKGTNAYEIGAKAVLSVPRLLLLNERRARSFVPTTRIEMGYGLFRRIGLYGLESANLAYSYVWRPNRRVWHDLRVPDVSYNNLYYTSPDFDLFLSENQAIRRSFDEQFIVGIGYTYTRTTQRGKNDRSWFLMSFGADEGGNILSGLFTLAGPRPEQGFTLFDQRFSQYFRVRPEVRYYQAIGSHGSQLVSRVLASMAVPYGNSTTVPYVKQFYSGGTNSLRAFRARSVGPGTYISDPTDNLLIDQVGDIKFEANLEYRFTLSGYFKAALFADAGNVWLYNDDPQRPGGQFHWDTALNELAVGAGAGLRFDPDVIVVRLDLATPLRRPELPAGDRWVFDDQYPKLSDNFILNIAIGYPF